MSLMNLTSNLEQDTRPSGAVLLPGCVIRQVEAGAAQPRYTLQLCRPDTSHVAGDAGSIWLAADSEAEFAEWSEMLDMAANKRRSQVRVVAINS